MLHPIFAKRMTMLTLRNLEMMEAMCSFDINDNVAIATTVWPESTGLVEQGLLDIINYEFCAGDRFFTPFISRGATAFCHSKGGTRDILDGMN